MFSSFVVFLQILIQNITISTVTVGEWKDWTFDSANVLGQYFQYTANFDWNQCISQSPTLLNYIVSPNNSGDLSRNQICLV